MPLPDCMMPNGADPCIGYKEQRREIERLRTQCAGLAQAAMNNGQELLLKEREVERLQAESAELRAELERWKPKRQIVP